MYCVHWPGQTMFGPFATEQLSDVVTWCEDSFGPNWKRIVTIHALEAPKNKLTEHERADWAYGPNGLAGGRDL